MEANPTITTAQFKRPRNAFKMKWRRFAKGYASLQPRQNCTLTHFKPFTVRAIPFEQLTDFPIYLNIEGAVSFIEKRCKAVGST